MSADDRQIILVDAFNLFIQQYCANPAMSSSGELAGGIVGFMNTLRHLMDKYMPPNVYVIWEGGGSTRRRSIYKDYKSNRRPEKMNRFYESDIPNTVENRDWQVATLIDLLRDIPICQVYVNDCEADDVIGYLCRVKFKDRKKMIVSSDKDYYQLLDVNTKIYTPVKKMEITSKEAIDRFHVSIQNFTTAKAFCGDQSDNIPGVERVNFKSLANKFPELKEQKEYTVSDIIDLASQRVSKKGPKIYQKIAESKEIAHRNWQLVHLDVTNLASKQINQIEHLVDEFVAKRDKMSLLRKLIKHGLSTFDADSLFYACSCIKR